MNNQHLYNDQDQPQEEEVFAEPPVNKTLFITQLSKNTFRPEAVEDLTNIDKVFAYYKPSCTCNFIDVAGNNLSESVNFTSIQDFSPDVILDRSPCLNEMQLLHKQLIEMKEKLALNRQLAAILSEPDSKRDFTETLKLLIHELASA